MTSAREAEGWTLRKVDENTINGAALWFYRRMLGIIWIEKLTNANRLKELNTKLSLLPIVYGKRDT